MRSDDFDFSEYEFAPEMDPSLSSLEGARRELIESSHGFPLSELQLGSRLLLTTAEYEVGTGEGHLMLDLIPRGSQGEIGSNEPARVRVDMSTFKHIVKGSFFELEGASINGQTSGKGILRRDCNAMLTPLKLTPFQRTTLAQESDEEKARCVDAGSLIEVGRNIFYASTLYQKPLETPELIGLCVKRPGARGTEVLQWRPPADLQR